MSTEFKNFRSIQTYLDINESDFIAAGSLFDNLHQRVIDRQVRSFEKGEYRNYYINRDNSLRFYRPTSILIYWNFRCVLYFHDTDELIYCPRTLQQRLYNEYDTRRDENIKRLTIFTPNIPNIFGWDSKELDCEWDTLNLIKCGVANVA